MRISSPPVVSPCFYGIDMADEDELAAAHRSVEEMREHVGATTLHYLSLDGMQCGDAAARGRASAAPASRGVPDGGAGGGSRSCASRRPRGSAGRPAERPTHAVGSRR